MFFPKMFKLSVCLGWRLLRCVSVSTFSQIFFFFSRVFPLTSGYCLCTVHEQWPLVRGKKREKKRKKEGENVETKTQRSKRQPKHTLSEVESILLFLSMISFCKMNVLR